MSGLLMVALPVGLWGPPLSTVSAQPSDAEEMPSLDPRFIAPPPPDQTGPRWVIATGGALLAAGLVGMLTSKGCVTRDETARCVDPYGGSSLYPSLIVLGFGTAISGAYWSRQREQPPATLRP